MEEEHLAVLKKEEYVFVSRAFFGGRTNADKLYRKLTPKELTKEYVVARSTYKPLSNHLILRHDSRWYTDLGQHRSGILGSL